MGEKISSFLSQKIYRKFQNQEKPDKTHFKIRFIFSRPLVSVILASYNHEDYVEEAVLSVLQQGIDSLQLIVVDDGSKDGTADKVLRIKNKRIELICLKENRQYHPRNLALSIAQGKYIAFQNSDDVWRENKLKKQLEILEKNQKLVACFTDVEIIGEKGEFLKDTWANGIFTKKNRNSVLWLRHFFDKGNCLCFPSSVIRKKSFQKIEMRLNPTLVQLSDFDLWIRLAAVGEFYILDEPLTAMRIVPKKNLSAPSYFSQRRSEMELMEVLERYIGWPVFPKVPEIFSDVLDPKNKSPVGILGGLAMYAWQLSPFHILLGNKIISSILKNDSQREKLVHLYGVKIIQTYFQKRGDLKILLGKDDV